MQILILANHSGGLYDFRKDLIAALKQHAEVSVAVPRNDRWDELQALADRVIELPIDRRGMNPARDADALYAAMRRFAELPPAQRAAMGAASHDWIARNFDKKAVVAETVAALL